jgi:hypothetical protein
VAADNYSGGMPGQWSQFDHGVTYPPSQFGRIYTYQHMGFPENYPYFSGPNQDAVAADNYPGGMPGQWSEFDYGVTIPPSQSAQIDDAHQRTWFPENPHFSHNTDILSSASSGALVDAKFRSQGLQGEPHQEDTHPSQSISDPRNIFSSVYLGAPIHLMGLLTEKKARIEALFRNTGICHRDLCFSAGFDEEVFANGGMFIQQAYFLSRTDFVTDEAQVVAALDELGKTLSPYSVVVSTPSRQYYSPTYLPRSGRCTYNEYISFHAKQKAIPGVHHKLVTTTLSPMMMGTGRQGGHRRDGNDKKDEESSGPVDEAKREGAPDEGSPGDNSDDAEENHGLQQVETNNNESSMSTSGLRLASGAPDNEPVEKPDAKNVIHFEVAFNIRHNDRGDQEIFNQSIRAEGTLQSEVIVFFDLSPRKDYYLLQEIAEALLADVISSSHIRFIELAFYGNAPNNRVDERYRQSDTEVKIDLGKGQGRFHLFDVNPRSTSKLGVERKELDTEERTRQLLTGISANVSFPWKPTFGGMCNFTIGQKGARTMESSVKVNRIIHTKTDQDTTWRYFIGDEWTQENGLCLPPNFDPPSAKFSFLGSRKPQKLKVGIKSSWVMPDSGVWDAYIRFGRNTPVLRGLATQIAFDIPPHMDAAWTVFHKVNATIVPRDNGYGVKSEMDMENMPKDFHASLEFSREAPPSVA